MLAVGCRQSMRAVIFDRHERVQLVFAQAFRAKLCGAKTEADENDERQGCDDDSAARHTHTASDE
jgi:hypothetical protein